MTEGLGYSDSDTKSLVADFLWASKEFLRLGHDIKVLSVRDWGFVTGSERARKFIEENLNNINPTK